MSWGKEGVTLPLGRGEVFRVTATSSGRPSSGMRPPGPGRRAARRLFILRYLTNIKPSTTFIRNTVVLRDKGNNSVTYKQRIVCIFVRLTSPVLPESEQRYSWLHVDNLLSASCHDTCMSCTCCAVEAEKKNNQHLMQVELCKNSMVFTTT